MIHNYYFYKNDSHLYVVRKPYNDNFTELDILRRYLSERYINWNQIKPTLVNCTVAPMAEGCSLNQTTLLTNNDTQSLDSKTSNTTILINPLLTVLVQQHQQILIIYLIFAILLSLILLSSIITCLRMRRSRSLLQSSLNSKLISYMSH